MFAAWVALVMAAGAVVAGAAQLEVEVAEGRITVGDPLTVRVVAPGATGEGWGEARLVGLVEEGWHVVAGPRLVSADPPVWELTLAALAVGSLALPRVEVGRRGHDGEMRWQEVAQPPVVRVSSVLAADDGGEPAAMRAPTGVGGVPWEWLLPALVAALPLAVGAWLWQGWRGRRRARSRVAAESPFEELQYVVTTLAATAGQGPAEEVCDRLAAGLRRYLGRRSCEPAVEMTSLELEELCRRRRWPEDVQRAVRGVMAVADGVRFARHAVGWERLRGALDLAMDAGRSLELDISREAGGAARPEARARP